MPTAIARRPLWTFKPIAPLLESGALVVSEAEVDELLESVVVVADDDSVLELAPDVVAAEDSVEAVDEEPVVVESVAVEEPDEVLAVPVLEAVEADATAVPVAPSMPKLGEKLMLLAS
ncbi:hypothetical protein LTR40_008407, partial [Exophiala xenobiotica]